MDATTAEFIVIYVIVIVILDIVTWKAGIQLKLRIMYSLIIALMFLFLKLVLGIQ
jgi:hypothetical protein